MKPFLAIDTGAASLKMAVFDPEDNGTLVLSHYEVVPLGLRGLEETDRTDLIRETLKDFFDRNEIRAKGMEINISTPSYQCFAKFLRTPAVEISKVGQIVQYEAASQVPFPLDEVEWGYQVMGTADTGELDVMLMALKNEVIESLSTICNDMGIRLSVVDGSPSALRNAFMHNYAEVEGCSMLLDIGAKTTNVIFIEGEQFFVRSINFGANAITQEFASESGLDWAQAEEYKQAYGYVHLTNVEEPTDPYQAILVRTARNVMTRLHQQVSQTIQYYRSQQGGQAPQRIYLAGGGSSLVYTAEFFIEKLSLPIEFFNPFRNIAIGSNVDQQALASNAHWLGEVAGSALRKTTLGLVEFNLLPKRERISRQIERRSPYAIAAVFCLGLIFFVQAAAQNSVAKKTKSTVDKVENNLSQFVGVASQLSEAQNRLTDHKSASTKMERVLQSRFYWIKLIKGIQEIFNEIEPEVYIVSGPDKLAMVSTNNIAQLQKTLNAQNITNASTAIWIKSLTKTMPTVAQAQGSSDGGGGGMGSGGMGSGGMDMGMSTGTSGMDEGMGGGSQGGGSSGPLEPIEKIYLKVQAKNILPRKRETLNREFAYLLLDQFKKNPLFSDSDETKVIGDIPPFIDAKTRWFEFVVQLKLESPIVMEDKELK